MKQELIQELALIYVKTHTNAETTVDEVYALYKKAAKELQKLDGKDFNNHVSSPDFSH